MGTRLFLNNVRTRVAAPVGAADLSVTVSTGTGAQFAGATGGDYIIATLVKMSGFLEIAWEVVKVTARVGDVLTITRAQEGTSALTFAVDDLVDVRPTAALWDLSAPGSIGSVTPAPGAFTTLLVTGVLTYGGVALTAGVTGTGKMVLDTNPVLVAPTLGAASSTSLICSSLTASLPVIADASKKIVSATQTGTGSEFVMSAGPTITGHPTIEGVTSTGATGSGKFVFDTSPLFTTDISTPAIKTASGALTVTPAAGSGLNIVLSTTGDFAVNTDDLVVDTSAGKVGIGTATPSWSLHVGAGWAAVDTNYGLIFDGSGGNTYIRQTTGNSDLRFVVNGEVRSTISSAGAITAPYQPAFLAYNSATDANVTGNGAAVTVDFDTEVFDQGGNFAADTFTAPVTGRYRFSVTVRAIEMANATLSYMAIATSNRPYYFSYDSIGTIAGSGYISYNGSVLADMDAGDTASVTFYATGIGANTADVYGTAGMYTFFSGELVC